MMRAAVEEAMDTSAWRNDLLRESAKPQNTPNKSARAEKIWPDNLWQIESFEYEEVPVMEGARHIFSEDRDVELTSNDSDRDMTVNGDAERELERARIEEAARAEAELIAAREREKAFAAGREAGLAEGRAAERKLREEEEARAESQRRAERAELVEGFDKAREAFLHEAELAVAKLALAIAARILRREAQMDPLLLTGAVRVALGQISSATRVRLKVPESDLPLWKEAIALVPKLSTRPEIVAGSDMRVGECIIETELGSADLGIRAQLQEIERGFFDRSTAPSTMPAKNSDGSSEERGEHA